MTNLDQSTWYGTRKPRPEDLIYKLWYCNYGTHLGTIQCLRKDYGEAVLLAKLPTVQSWDNAEKVFDFCHKASSTIPNMGLVDAQIIAEWVAEHIGDILGSHGK
jgi:hypothetical protein